jgi:hypothetical protein
MVLGIARMVGKVNGIFGEWISFQDDVEAMEGMVAEEQASR